MLSAAETYGIVTGGLARRRSSLQRGIHGSDAERTRRAAAMHGVHTMNTFSVETNAKLAITTTREGMSVH